MIVTRPMKALSEAITNEQLELLDYKSGVLGSPKLDGYRCLTGDGVAYTSSMKKITNNYIQEILSKQEHQGLDGEVVVGQVNHLDAFNHTTGPVRRADGEPDFKLYVFDSLRDLTMDYKDRSIMAYAQCEFSPWLVYVEQVQLHSVQEVIDFEEKCVADGYEGAMIRQMNGPYKQGRTTLKERNIFKRKPTVDDECEIIGFIEQMRNLNKKEKNELGLTKRSAHKANKVGKDTLGKLVCRSNTWKNEFLIGTGQGMTAKLRKEIWENQEKFLGQTYKYKYQKHGSINDPRQAIGLGFRDPADMTDY